MAERESVIAKKGKEKSLKEIMNEAAEYVHRTRESKNILGLRRQKLVPGNEGGGEYLEVAVVGMQP